MPTREQNNLAKELSDYFESLATSSTHIANGNYYLMGVEELTKLGTNVNFNGTFGLVYEPIDARLNGKALTDCTLTANIALWFLKHSPKDDFAAKSDVLQEAFRIAMQFLARIRKDHEDYLKGDESLAITSRFDLNNVELNIVGPIGDYHYGYTLEFSLVNDGFIIYTSGDWE